MSTIAVPSVAAIADKLSGIPEFIENEVGVIGRRTEMQILLICIGGKLHPLMYGSPGVAKSMTVDAIRRHFPHMTQFKTQAYKASPPSSFSARSRSRAWPTTTFIGLSKVSCPMSSSP